MSDSTVAAAAREYVSRRTQLEILWEAGNILYLNLTEDVSEKYLILRYLIDAEAQEEP